MSKLIGIMRYEFRMSIRRKGLWAAFGMIFMFLALGLNTTTGEGMANLLTGQAALKEAGEVIYMHNLLLPLVAGILAADRLQRDVHLNLRELQLSAPLTRWTYVLGKYLGVLTSSLLSSLIFVLLYGALAAATGLASPNFILAELVTYLAIVMPSFIFVIPFSLACPLVMPLRVYQILFTGYWFWGNFLDDRFFPTISDTLLNASGVYALRGFFHGEAFNQTGGVLYTPAEAWLNILALCLCAACALFTIERYLARQSKRA